MQIHLDFIGLCAKMNGRTREVDFRAIKSIPDFFPQETGANEFPATARAKSIYMRLGLDEGKTYYLGDCKSPKILKRFWKPVKI